MQVYHAIDNSVYAYRLKWNFNNKTKISIAKFPPFNINSLWFSTDLCQQRTKYLFCILNNICVWFMVSSEECHQIVFEWNNAIEVLSWELVSVWECHIVIANNPSEWILYQNSSNIGSHVGPPMQIARGYFIFNTT